MANIKLLNGYLEAEIVSARVSASKMGFFVSPDGDAMWEMEKMKNTYR